MNWKKNIQQIMQEIYCYLAGIWLTGIEKESSDGNGLDLVSPHTGLFYNMMLWDSFVWVFFETFDLDLE